MAAKGRHKAVDAIVNTFGANVFSQPQCGLAEIAGAIQVATFSVDGRHQRRVKRLGAGAASRYRHS